MDHQLFNYGNRFIRGIFYFFFGLTTYFAITSANLVLGDNAQTGSGTTIVTALALIVAIAVVLVGFTYPRVAHGFKWLFVQHQATTATLLLIAVVA